MDLRTMGITTKNMYSRITATRNLTTNENAMDLGTAAPLVLKRRHPQQCLEAQLKARVKKFGSYVRKVETKDFKSSKKTFTEVASSEPIT